MNRLQAQKSGSGAKSFEFLSEDTKKKIEIDTGFNKQQLKVVEDIEQVLYISIL